MINKEILKQEGLEAFGLYYSFYDAIVVSNSDPEKRFRLKVKCPAVFGEEEVWAKPRNCPVGNNFGLFILPENNQIVRLTFQGGSAEHPYWEYSELQTKPPTELLPKSYLIKSPAGDYVRVGNEQIMIKNKAGYTITFDNNGIEIKKGLISFKTDIIDELLNTLKTAVLITPSGNGSFSPDAILKFETILTKMSQIFK